MCVRHTLIGGHLTGARGQMDEHWMAADTHTHFFHCVDHSRLSSEEFLSTLKPAVRNNWSQRMKLFFEVSAEKMKTL